MDSRPTRLSGQLKLDLALARLLTPSEVFALAGQDLIEALKEDRRIERKPASYPPRAVGDYICMWANTPPEGGILALGVDDDGTCTGFSSQSQDRVNELERAGHIFCPDARCDVKHV